MSTVVNETENASVKKKKKTFGQSDGIMCRSVVEGGLYVEGSKTGMLYSFSDYGDETEIEYRDLVAMIRTKDKTVYEPRLMILDEDFLAEFPAVNKFYEDQFSTKDIKAILDKPINEMLVEINKLPKGAFESLKSIAAKQVSTGRLDSVRKIKALDELFGTDLSLVGELFGEN